MKWGVGPIDKEMGSRDDVDLDVLTPDSTTPPLVKPDLQWDGPAQDRPNWDNFMTEGNHFSLLASNS